MKIEFDDKSFVECKKENNKIYIVIQAKDLINPLKKINNCVELTEEQFKQLISDLS